MGAYSYLDQLNTAQRAAVEYVDGPQLVIAGAGSGKTRVLTYKIVHLLALGYNPRQILALTFTNKAAREMRQRIELLAGAEVAAKLWMGTFHSVFSRFLRMYADRLGFPSNFTIYDSADSKSLVKSIMRELQLDDKIYRPGIVLADISNAKNNLYSPEQYCADEAIQRSDRDAKRPETGRIYTIYRDRCRIAGAMDFDDLLYYTNVLLRDNPDVLERFRDYFQYILVDEYQDTNFAQHLIVRQLTGAAQRLCVVGDDAQSIYSFRGANIRNILDLRKSFPTLRTFKLEENYRSTQNIIGAANTLIAANKEQIPKEVFSRGDSGEPLEVVQCYNDYEEAYTIAAGISRVRMRYHLHYDDIAILYRTNAQSRVLEEALRNRNIPYRVYGGQAFYQRKEVKDAVSYFRLAVNPADDEALRRVINTPKRGIGDTTIKKILAAAISAGKSMYDVLDDPYAIGVNRGTAAKLADFKALIAKFVGRNADGENAATLARVIISDTGLLNEYLSDKTPENVSRHENVLELIKGVDQFVSTARETRGQEATGMSDFLAEVSLLTDQDTQNADGDSVTLMTIHSAKGLEFDAVFIAGVEEDLLPSAMSAHDPAQVEEERRLMYVAITRAKRYCQASYASKRAINGKTVQTFPSRFLRDISPRFIRLVSGSKLGAPKRTDSYNGYNSYQKTDSYNSSDIYYKPQPIPTPTPTPIARPAASGARPATKPSGTAAGGFNTHTAAELHTGQRMEHPTFGMGVIKVVDTSRADDRIVVTFSSDGSERTLLLKFARFKLLS